MILLTMESYPGKDVTPIGLVKGSTIQTANMFKDIGSALKTLIGGELKNYNEMMAKARDAATERMVRDAEEIGADAVIGVRYATSAIMQGAAEIMVYGTAVKLR